MNIKNWIFSIVLAALGSMATAQKIAPGNYVYEGGNGSLNIGADKAFSIDTVGGNGHICGLEGVMSGREGRMTDSKCIVKFKSSGKNLQLSTNEDESCRQYCGARAGFDGLYIMPSSACTPSAIEATRKSFLQKYSQKQFVIAVQKLAPLLIQCKQVINWGDEQWIRNDLALAQFRSGDKAACLKTLSPLNEIAAMTDEEIRGVPEPAYVEHYLDIAKATRTNLRLCKTAP
jgi:hypothetical protein